MVRNKKGDSLARLRPVHLLLFVPFVAVLWVGLYNREGPELAGIPFFYWYQLAWIPLGALLIWPVFIAENRHHRRNDADRDGHAE